MKQQILIINQKKSLIFAEVLKEMAYLTVAGFDPKKVTRHVKMKWDIESEEEILEMLEICCDLMDKIRGLMHAAGLSKKDAEALMNAFLHNLMHEMKLRDPQEDLPQSGFLS